MHLSPVTHSADLDRIAALARRPPVDLESVKARALVALMQQRLSKTPRKEHICDRFCIKTLKPIQALALFEAPLVGGELGFIGVGSGKTLLNILVAMVFTDVRTAVLLVPPGLVAQLFRDYNNAREHFKCPSLVMGNDPRGVIIAGAPLVHIVPYSRLSRPNFTAQLEALAPDLIVADEGHKLRHKDTATTSRVMRYLGDHPATKFCVWSGTLGGSSLKHFAHLAAHALGEGSPVPIHYNALEEWALAIDPSDWPAPRGALAVFCNEGEHIHKAFHRRLIDTRGVIATKASATDASLYIAEKKAPPMPEKLTAMLADLRASWTRPDGEELIDILSAARSARELAMGFFYRWIFPHGEPPELIDRWFEVRKLWHKELREKLKRRREHLDSPMLLANAARRAVEGYTGALPIWHAEHYSDWEAIKDKVQPETQAVWVDDYLARDAAQWATSNKGVVWYAHRAFGERVAEIAGLPLHGGGIGAEARILAETGKRSIVASIQSHGTGRDGLQKLFNQQLIANPPASADSFEQLLGRLHRIGQASDDVTSYVYRHTSELADAIDNAIKQARFAEDATGNLQKLLAASFDWTG